MALAFQSGSNAFLDDQRPVYSVNYWDTTYTPESAGIEFTLFDLLDGVAFEQSMGVFPQTVAQSVLENTSTGLLFDTAVVRPVLGYSTPTAYNTGVTPLMYHYWGAGSLPGGKIAKKLLLKYRGDVKVAGAVTMIFGGQGRIQVYKNGTEIGYGEVYEPLADPDLSSLAQFEEDGGYYVLTQTFSVGDDLEIYYWHNNEPWGGVFGKILTGTMIEVGGTPTGDEFLYAEATVRDQLRDAPVMGASFFGTENGGGDLSSSTLPYVEKITIDRDRDKVTDATITVALTTSDQPDGFSWDEATRSLVDNDTALTYREDRRIEIVTGYGSAGDLKDGSGIVTDAETYTRLTGHIKQFSPTDDLKTMQISCGGFEQKLLDHFDENFPDRLSYHAAGFIYREGASEPVWGIPAFDNWPIESALYEYCLRSGIDPLYLGKAYDTTNPSFGRKSAYTETGQALTYTRKLFGVRFLGDSTKLVQVERNTAYGNVGLLQKDYLPPDEEYLFKPEVTRRMYDQVTQIAEHYGYHFQFDPMGRAYLRPGNNPDAFIFADTPGALTLEDGSANNNVSSSHVGITIPADRTTEPSALGGRYVEKQDSELTWSIVVEGYFSRLDLYAGVGDNGTRNGGLVDFDVEVYDGGWVSAGVSGTVSTYYDGEESYYYDGLLRTDGTNATVFEIISLPFDRYRVTLTDGGIDPSDGNGDADYRINGIGVFYQDPLGNYYPTALATDTNVLTLMPKATHEDLRNHVIVVGARKGVITDSAKLAEETNPNNPDLEFHVAVAADPASIYDPDAVNFVGSKKIAVIYDDKVSDSDFARWLALTTLFRYRNPSYQVPIETLALPQMELGDAVLAYEARHESVNQIVWVQGFRESWGLSEATVSLTTTGYPDVPSYQPREEVPIDTLFDPDGDGRGEPIVDLQVTYTNLMGVTVTNADLDAPVFPVPAASYTTMTAGPQEIALPIMPETIHLSATSLVPGTYTAEDRFVVNHPYRHFYHISGWNASHHPTLTYDVQEGDGDSDVYSAAYYDMPSSALFTWYVHYHAFTSRTGENPFYDPYSSELGHLVDIKFDALVSGRYRVSIWDARNYANKATPVAWLTNPEADGLNPEAHWTYVEPGSQVDFSWDGVDNIGQWNRLQSRDYAQRQVGSFGEAPLAVGEGFYAWNDQSTPIRTQIGDAIADNYRTGGDIREDDYPYFTLGRYGKFFIRVEVLNDDLARKDRRNGYLLPRTVDSNALPPTLHDTDEVYVWTHLGEPNQVNLAIEEWDVDKDTDPGEPVVPAGEYVEGTTVDGWVTLGTSDDALLRNGKPVKITFDPRPRPGTLFADSSYGTSVILTREAHLQATIMDQFWTFYGKPWDSIDARNASIPEKRLTSRMFHNNDHTKAWADNGFRTGTQLSNLEWIFQPEHFEVDFGKGFEESIEYGDYEQLEALPGYNPRQAGGVVRDDEAYITHAFMNYLFYFSAHTLDRSGRRQWCLNRKFIDKSKIVTSTWRAASYNEGTPSAAVNAYAVDYEDKGAETYLKRTVFVREWRDTDWKSAEITTRTPLSPRHPDHPGTDGITDADQQKWVQFPITALDPLENTVLDMDTASEHLDDWLAAYKVDSNALNDEIRFADIVPGEDKTFPVTGTGYIRPGAYGAWNFKRGSQVDEWYKPSPRLDFHPYWNNLMPNWHVPTTNLYVDNDSVVNEGQDGWDVFDIGGGDVPLTNAQHVFAIPSSHIVHALRDEKGQENWFGYAFRNLTGPHGAYLEQSVRGWAADKLRTALGSAFDYVRQDTLARFDQFRGVVGRAVYQDRDTSTFQNFWRQDDSRFSAAQPVRPSGQYLLNLARYKDYIISFPHDDNRNAIPQHFTTDVTDWYYLRFQQEYVWYNDRHFPVDGFGTTRYDYFREEYSNVRSIVPGLWHQGPQERNRILYDGGAWTGWKDDIASADWSSNPRLRWKENSNQYFSKGFPGFEGYQVRNSGLSAGTAWSSGGVTAGTTAYEQFWMGNDRYYQKRNIYDDALGFAGFVRLAVGPELATSRELYMNLVLPTNLKDAA